MSAAGLARILPATVSTVESFGDIAGATLHPTERPLVERAVPQRRAEFATTRHCARLALKRLGHPSVPILSGDRRQPLWPDGVTGSLTHCVGYRAAAVAHTGEVASLGIDAEPNLALPPDVLEPISSDAERAMLGKLPDRGVYWDRLLFSAKESIYKAWFPLTGAWLGFHDVQLSIDPDGGTFETRFLVSVPSAGDSVVRLRGSWIECGGFVLTAAVAPVDDH